MSLDIIMNLFSDLLIIIRDEFGNDEGANSLFKIFKKLNSMHIDFKTKIEYTNDSIIEVFNQISKIIYEDKDNIFKNVITNLEKDELYENWQKSLLNEEILKEDDKQILKLFGKNLGKLDKKRTN